MLERLADLDPDTIELTDPAGVADRAHVAAAGLPGRGPADGGGPSATGWRGSSARRSSVPSSGPRVEGRERLPAGPAIYCFNHLSWTDPFVLMATLPFRPRLSFFGPKEEDMAVGGRNRLMTWTGTAIPYKPGKNDLLEATRRVARGHRPAASSRSPGRAGSTPVESATCCL